MSKLCYTQNRMGATGHPVRTCVLHVRDNENDLIEILALCMSAKYYNSK